MKTKEEDSNTLEKANDNSSDNKSVEQTINITFSDSNNIKIYDESTEKNESEKRNETKTLFICRKCFKCPKVKINDNISYNVSCFCQKCKGVNFNFILDNYILNVTNESSVHNLVKDDNLKRFNYLYCEYHQEQLYGFCYF